MGVTAGTSPGGEIEHAATEQGRITVSIGAASWQGWVANDVSSVVKAADEALYHAKQACCRDQRDARVDSTHH
jgi:GGDEF domain-containing protein